MKTFVIVNIVDNVDTVETVDMVEIVEIVHGVDIVDIVDIVDFDNWSNLEQLTWLINLNYGSKHLKKILCELDEELLMEVLRCTHTEIIVLCCYKICIF